jgi:tetratricopeptide (TPR) repeat protein
MTNDQIKLELNDLRSWISESLERGEEIELDEKTPIRGKNLQLPLLETIKRNDDAKASSKSGKPLGTRQSPSTSEKIVDTHPAKMAHDAKDKGNELFKMKKYAEAIKAYTIATQDSTIAGVAWINCAQAHILLKQWKEAEDACTNGLSMDKKNIKGWYRRAVAKRHQGDLNGALEDLQAAQKIDSNNPAVLEEMALLTAESRQKSNPTTAPTAPSKPVSSKPVPSKPTSAPVRLETLDERSTRGGLESMLKVIHSDDEDSNISLSAALPKRPILIEMLPDD